MENASHETLPEELRRVLVQARAPFLCFPEDLSRGMGGPILGSFWRPNSTKKQFEGSREALEGAPERSQILGSVFEQMGVRVSGRVGPKRESKAFQSRSSGTWKSRNL